MLVLHLHSSSRSENINAHVQIVDLSICLGWYSSINLAQISLLVIFFYVVKNLTACIYDNITWGLKHTHSLPSVSSPDSQSSPLVRGGLLGSVRVPQSSATCMSWGGAHYRTFDRKHFHFQGSCTYLLASSTDGTWAVYISTVCDGRGDCSKVWNMALIKYY